MKSRLPGVTAIACRSASFVLFLCALAGTSQKAGPEPFELRPGELISAVSCLRSPANSYALYLPRSYTPQKKWPIIYAFDPDARGDIPVRLYSRVAEKYGYIIAGSNNSRNFGPRSQISSGQAMLEDTFDRFSVDPKRIYTTGFSGGARVATMVALRCSCRVAGVIASGATYPVNSSPSPHDSFLYFIGLGDTDFNYPEVVQVRIEKERLGAPYRIRIFPGPHQWSPPAVFDEALAWFQLRAMQAGLVAKEIEFIFTQQQLESREAAEADRAHDFLQEYQLVKSLAADFRGLMDTSDAESKLQRLKKSSELKRSLERERRDVEAQQVAIREISGLVASFSQGDSATAERLDLKQTIVSRMAQLRLRAKSTKDQDRGRIYERGFNSLFAQIVEEGQRRQAAKRYDEALSFYGLLAEAAPERAWPHLLIAETRLALGDRKRALKAIQRAAETGRIDARMLQEDQDLAPLFDDPEFQRVVGDLAVRVKTQSE